MRPPKSKIKVFMKNVQVKLIINTKCWVFFLKKLPHKSYI